MGAILFTFARLTTWALGGVFEPYTVWWNNDFAPFDYSGTVFVSALLALVLPLAINRFSSKERAAKKAAIANGNLIELVIQQGMDAAILIELSLRGGKSYVGFAAESGITAPNRESDVAIIPLASGYRDEKTRELELTTDYASIIDKVNFGGLSHLEEEDLRIVFPKGEIVSARLFDIDVYQELSIHRAERMKAQNHA